MRTWYQGLPLTGKTTKLIEVYNGLVHKGTTTDEILVLLMDTNQGTRWRDSLSFDVAGSLKIHTYWGFVQAEIAKFWNLVKKTLYTEKTKPRPTFMNVEAAHYLMSQLINEARQNKDLFYDNVATPPQIALQIQNNLNLAAISGIGIDEAYRRLMSVVVDDVIKANMYLEALEISKKFQAKCQEACHFDYSSAMEIYQNHLLPDNKYQEILRNRYQTLIVDNLEESIPSQVDFISILLRNIESAYVAYDPSGGHTRFFGADPDYAWDQLKDSFEIIDVENRHDSNYLEVVSCISNSIRNRTTDQKCHYNRQIFEVVKKDYRSELFLELTDRIKYLIQDGHSANEIAIVAPVLDKVIDVSLINQLRSGGVPVARINQKSLLLDEQFAQVLVSLASLVQNPDITGISLSDLASTLEVLLELDPIRSKILANYCYKQGMSSLRQPPIEIVSRVGFAAADRYMSLCKWIEIKREQLSDENIMFQQLFGEMLAPLIRNQEDIITSRQVIKSALKFDITRKAIIMLTDEPFLDGFTGMIKQGTVAADVIKLRSMESDVVVIATPLALFKTSRSFKHQFWLDFSSKYWLQRDISELNNYYLLSKRWNRTWDDQVDNTQRNQKSANIIAGLLYRCSGKVTIMESEYDSLGQEQESILSDLILESVVCP